MDTISGEVISVGVSEIDETSHIDRGQEEEVRTVAGGGEINDDRDLMSRTGNNGAIR